jgi:hypothetical protein
MNGIRLDHVPWNERIEKLVIELDPIVGVEALKLNVGNGTITAYEVFFDENSIGFFLARGETLWNGAKELVILHAVSEVKGRTPLSSLLSVFLPRLAKDQGYASIRIHSERRGLDAVLEETGFKFQETVFVKKVA